MPPSVRSGLAVRSVLSLRPAIVVLLIGLVILTAVWTAQRRLVYFPADEAPPPAARVLSGGVDVTLTTSDGLRLGAWFFKPRLPDRHVAVLVANGNAGNRTERIPLARALVADGFTVLLFDYRGYGGNPGRPSEAGLARDVRAARQYLFDAVALSGDRVIYYGESLGAAVVTELAMTYPPSALVLRSPFTDLAAVGDEHYPLLPVRTLLWDRFPIAERVARITVPTAVIYGSDDTIVPPQQSRTVADRAGGPVWVTKVDGADHNDYALTAGPEVVATLVTVAGWLERTHGP